jgi:hypothetical protein
MDDANRAERILGDAIGRHIIEAIDAGFQPPLYVAYVSVSGAAGVWSHRPTLPSATPPTPRPYISPRHGPTIPDLARRHGDCRRIRGRAR